MMKSYKVSINQRSRVTRWLFMLGLATLLAGCNVPQPGHFDATGQGNPKRIHDEYRLGVDDRLRVIVFGEDDLSGEFVVDSTGGVALPLVGQVAVSGLTLREFEEAVADSLKQGYLLNPNISAEVLNYRPFYIIGEVNKGGEYPYKSGINVLNAVAIAGGYTYRANQNRVSIKREESNAEMIYSIDAGGVTVLPGDVVTIPERFF